MKLLSFFDYFLMLLKSIFEIKDHNIEGKLVLQKTFYFAKELGLEVPFTFRWGKLGPYSYELSNVMERITSQRFTVYKGHYEYNEDNFRYVKDIEIPTRVSKFFIDLDNLSTHIDKGIVELYEATASLHFLYKYSELDTKAKVFQRIKELKTDRIYRLESLLEPSWKFLQSHGLVNNIPEDDSNV